ncbi:myoneurin isoform X3 [Syngnathus acus]|uniref:myoneurin isoform X3 n=1 Tax=Syngnathus acus TaxID=161584 RepID=UPI00188614AB|nr:myoneurin isoform X3 [Syngnathus acus]
MNGTVYIPFFQGQLESVLEQVVQLAVHEISSTVGSSLNALLLEAAVQEQENSRLRLRLQARESPCGHDEGGADIRQGQAEAAAREDDGPDAGRTKRQQLAEPRGSTGVPTDSRRLEQRCRVVEQLKCAMERVLHLALCQLKKMVEASFDDLLLEITQKECERQTLQTQLDRRLATTHQEAPDNLGTPSGLEDALKDAGREQPKAEEAGGARGTEDKADAVAFGQKWSGDIRKLKGSAGGGGAAGRSSREGPAPPSLPPHIMDLTLESSPLQDPRWTPLEDMDVLGPDWNATPPPAPPLNPSGSRGGRSSASMLQRLLTASQLPEDHAGGAHKKPQGAEVAPADQGAKQEEDEHNQEEEEEGIEEEEEEEDKGRKRRKVWSECEDCGRRFSRVLLLKAHRQIHADAGVSPSQCSHCGKTFSSAGRLHSHLRAKHQS